MCTPRLPSVRKLRTTIPHASARAHFSHTETFPKIESHQTFLGTISESSISGKFLNFVRVFHFNFMFNCVASQIYS